MTLDGRILVSFRDSQNVGDFLTGCGTVSFWWLPSAVWS
jgi:hypothetical protein